MVTVFNVANLNCVEVKPDQQERGSRRRDDRLLPEIKCVMRLILSTFWLVST